MTIDDAARWTDRSMLSGSPKTDGCYGPVERRKQRKRSKSIVGGEARGKTNRQVLRRCCSRVRVCMLIDGYGGIRCFTFPANCFTVREVHLLPNTRRPKERSFRSPSRDQCPGASGRHVRSPTTCPCQGRRALSLAARRCPPRRPARVERSTCVCVRVCVCVFVRIKIIPVSPPSTFTRAVGLW